MKLASAPILALLLCASAAHAQNARTPGETQPISITGNFQLRIPVEPSASTADMIKALAQANQSLGDLASRQCEVLEGAFKGDCRVAQLNMGANINDRRGVAQFNNDFSGQRQIVNANLNVTFEITPRADESKSAPAGK